jgi:hypothetical protein
VTAPPADALRALSRKYRTLSALRRERERDGTVGARSLLRALAREFPGALRELDTLPLDEIDRRVGVLDAAAEGSRPPEPWMAWMVAYHATMRTALSVKARVARQPADSAATYGEVAALLSQKLRVSIDVTFVRAVANPPGGRLNRVVFEHLSAEFGVAADEMWQTLFPSRRPGRRG